MWTPFQCNGGLYLIKLMITEHLEIYLSELETVWTQKLPKEAILQQFQELNPLFDIKLDEAIAEIQSLLSNIDETVIVISMGAESLEFNIKSKKSEFPVQFTFHLEKAPSDLFLKEVTAPLMQSVKHLEQERNMLLNLIQKKDRELEEYKLEKGTISRVDLATEKFDPNIIQIENKSMMNIVEGSASFWEHFVNKFGRIESNVENLDVKSDPWNHIQRKRKVYSSKTAIKKGKGINYNLK